ncbi:hypothetical protein [Micromonospora sp. NPDC093277]|uniref:hypothetical protein n=1 Tax=Micromonospora sp. NPDC093277 TaxID=3364291 RepID=UPI00382B5CFB
MPAAEPPPGRGGAFRRFVGRYESQVLFACMAVVGGALLLIWHRWDVRLLEQPWFQAILLLAFSAAIIPLLFWGEGGLPPAGGESGRRRPRAERKRRRGRRTRANRVRRR